MRLVVATYLPIFLRNICTRYLFDGYVFRYDIPLSACWNSCLDVGTKNLNSLFFFSFSFGIPQIWELSIVFGILLYDAMENDDYQRAYAGTRAMNNQTKYIQPQRVIDRKIFADNCGYLRYVMEKHLCRDLILTFPILPRAHSKCSSTFLPLKMSTPGSSCHASIQPHSILIISPS